MSIYATLWKLKFPIEGDYIHGYDWIEIIAQGVPAHIGSPSEDQGYETDPFSSFLPPPVEVDESGDAPYMRAVVFITPHTQKGTDANGQEYVSPLLTLTGREYSELSFQELHDRICAALRGNRTPIVAQVFRIDGSTQIFRAARREE